MRDAIRNARAASIHRQGRQPPRHRGGRTLLNTAVEYVCDIVAPDYNVVVKHAKDVAAAAVLLSEVGAASIGAGTFGPYLQLR